MLEHINELSSLVGTKLQQPCPDSYKPRKLHVDQQVSFL